MTNLAAWLELHGLRQYAAVLAENDIDLAVLPHLSDDDLKELGLSLGHRRKLLAAASELTLPERVAGAAAAQRAAVGNAQAQSAEDAAERRQLTVLFCDLVGSTELSVRLGAEDVREVMTRYQEAVSGAIVAYDGHVAKLLGDGVLAHFGWPSAHEDDAERAVRAALAAVAATAELDAAGAPLAARAAVATGPVVVGDLTTGTTRETAAVSGPLPNLAARLQALAEPGEVVIHEATKRLIGDSFALEDRGRHELKGFSEPVTVWRVSGPGTGRSRFDTRHGGALTEFVGRTHEIGLLDERWQQARNGEGQVVLLSGEAGIGKSRILREFANRLESPCRTLAYQCSPHEVNAAFHPLIAEIETTIGCTPVDSAEQRLARLETHLDELFDDREDAVALLAPLLSLPADRHPALDLTPQRHKQRTIALLVDRVARLARKQPLALLVEDIHWVDASTLETLEAMVERVRDLPVMVLMTHRPGFLPPWPQYGHVTMHSLNRLGSRDAAAIAIRAAGGRALPQSVLDRVLHQTDGIPLFIEELTKAVLEAGPLEEQGGRYVLTGPLPALDIPTTLQDSLMARLDRLAPVKRVIQAAACIGREFEADLLGAALSMSGEELDAALDRLLDAELIYRRHGRERMVFVFKHALVQDTAYGSLVTRTRQHLHERLARALEQSENADELELARHFHGAGHSAEAAALYLSAGRRLLQGSAIFEAIGALERGLEAVRAIEAGTERDRLELDMRIALGAARMISFGWQHRSVRDALEPALPLAKSLKDAGALGALVWGIPAHFATRAEITHALDWLLQQWPIARESPDTGLKVLYHMTASDQYFWKAEHARSLEHTEEVRRLYDPTAHAGLASVTNHDPLCHSQNFAGSLCEYICGRPDRALERMEEALAHARRIGHPFNLMFTLTAGSTALLYLGRSDRLLEQCAEAEEVVERELLGQFAEEVCVGQWRGAARIMRGEFAEGYALTKSGNDYWNSVGGRLCDALFKSWLVEALFGMGRIDEALEMNGHTVAHCRETGDRFMQAECVRMRGELYLAAAPSEPGRAEGLFREAVAIAGDQWARSWELRAATSLARLLHAQARRPEANQALDAVLDRFRHGPATPDLARAQALRSAQQQPSGAG